MIDRWKVNIASLILSLWILATVQAAVPRVYSIKPRCGSLNGGTRITIYGKNFARNYFNYGAGNEDLGSKVWFSKLRDFECEIHEDGSQESQIMCYTKPMPAGKYKVKVSVDGEPVADDQYCTYDNWCTFETKLSCTPTISKLVPFSGMPGSFLEMTGDIRSINYGSNEPVEDLDIILRVFYGGQKCEVYDMENDQLYGITMNSLKCLAQGRYIGNIRVSFLVSNDYGRSLPSPSTLHVRSNNEISMYQAFTEISHISQDKGSTEGGLLLTITGQYFDDTNADPRVLIGGEECESVELIDDNTIVCRTPAKASDGVDHFTGNRGWYSYIHFGSSEADDFVNGTKNISHVDSSMYDEEHIESFHQKLTGYFISPYHGDYDFYVRSDNDDDVDFLMSNTSDPQFKVDCSSDCTQNLQAGSAIYMEVLRSSDGSSDPVMVEAFLADSPLSEEETGMAQHEIQKIMITSRITKDEQKIEVAKTGSAGAKQEDVQTMTIEGLPGSLHIAIGLNHLYTEPITLAGLTGATVKEELEKLSTVDFTVTVDVSATANETVLVINSDSSLGEINDYQGVVVDAGQEALNFSVERTTLGKPNLQTFTLEMDGIPTLPIDVGASSSDVLDALKKLFEVPCHPKLSSGQAFSFETSQYGIGGRVSDEEPFCGGYSLKNPSYVYHKGEDESEQGLRLSNNQIMCFAYKGLGKVDYVRVYFSYIDSDLEKRTTSLTFRVGNPNPSRWVFECENINELVSNADIEGTFFYITYVRVYRDEGGENLFLDQVIFKNSPPLSDALKDGVYYMRGRQVKPNGYYIDRLTVTAEISSGKTKYGVELSPYYCGYDLPLFKVAGASESGATYTIENDGYIEVNITRESTASPPIGGNFTVTFKGSTSPAPIPVPRAIDTDLIADHLNAMAVGPAEVTGSGTCSSFYYKIKLVSHNGAQELIQVDESQLTGTDVAVEVTRVQKGGLWFKPLMGDLLRTYHTTPQVMVFINNIPTQCLDELACTFDWSDDYTPTVANISPAEGYHGLMVTIIGTGFDDSNVNKTVVIIGTTPCTVDAVSSTTINCTINNGPTGDSDVKVYVAGKGLARTTQQFRYVTDVTSFVAEPGSVEGGTVLTFDGYGFTDDATVTVDGRNCTIVRTTQSQIKCKTPRADDESITQIVGVVISQVGSQIEAGNFTYNTSLPYTPVITAISPLTSDVWGGDPLEIKGEGFTDVEEPVVTLGGERLNVTFFNDTCILAILPALRHGLFRLQVSVQTFGFADLRKNNIPDISYIFQVNSMTPVNGSLYGGTDVLISGEGFISNSSMFDISLGKHACDIDFVNSTHIKCRIADTGARHHLSATGRHINFGVGYAWSKDPFTVKVGDYVTWSWETPFYVNDIAYGVHETETASDIKNKEGGFSSGENTVKGQYTHRFSRPGTYFYWTGFMDSDNFVFFRGTIHVRELLSHSEVLRVEMFEHEATYNTGGTQEYDNLSCATATAQLSNCNDTTSLMPDPNKFNFNFLKCYSPFFDSISPSNGTINDLVNLTGDGFGDTNCQNEILYGDADCDTQTSSQTDISFKVSAVDEPPINALQMFNLRVANLGYALTTITNVYDKHFILTPYVESVDPSEGSKVGGITITIHGSGFVGAIDDIVVDIQTMSCETVSVSYDMIKCLTHCGSAPGDCFVGSREVTVRVRGAAVDCEPNVCNYTTTEESTPTVTSVSPDTVSAGSTEITINGTGFGTLSGNLQVLIGDTACVISGNVTDTSFICTVGRLPVGTNKVNVNVIGKGNAATTEAVESSAIASIIFPSESSLHGGATMVITGNGFVDGKTSVLVGTKECTVISTALDSVNCTLPPQDLGSYDVSIESDGVNYNTLQMNYSLQVTPRVMNVTQSQGQSGDNVTISGYRFMPGSTEPTVTIGGVDCIVIDANETTITCTAGTQQTGSYDVVVFVEETGKSNHNVEFIYEVGDFTVSPSRGSTNGGQIITLTGSGFLEDDTLVTICGVPCTEVNVSASEYVCITPPASSLTDEENCTIVAAVDTVTNEQVDVYTYDPNLLLNITHVDPRRGGTGGGTSVTINGTNFGDNADDIEVTIAGVACVVQFVSHTHILCRTGAARSADAQVSVQRKSWGEAVQSDAAFEYIDVWSSPYTWGGNSPPGKGEFVIIQAGQKILLDTNTDVLKMLLIQGGEFIFDEENIELKAENILITDGGLFQIGSEEKHFPSDKKAIITLYGHLRSKELPIYGTKTLAVRNGTLDLFGAPTSQTWTRLNNTAYAGNNTIDLEAAVDWQAGDKIVIATTGDRHSQKESEVHVIQSVSNGGLTLTLEAPLSYEHIGISGTFDGITVDFRAEVGLLTHNILVQGNRNEDFDTTIEACPEGFDTGEFATQTCFQGRFGEELGSDQFGAQIMLHQVEVDTQVAQAHLQFVELTHVGQAFRLGRYPIHFHLNGDMDQSYVRGCSIYLSYNRAVNIHGSHNAMIEYNVIYNIMGGAFFLEDGGETGNTFQYNLAIFVRSSTSLRNDDVTPAAFWATNPNNNIIHNAVAGGTHFGTWYRMLKHPDGPSFDSNICPQAELLGAYHNNSAHSLGWFGLWIFETYVPLVDGRCGNDHTVAKFYSLTAWNCEKGAEAVNSGALQFHGFVLVNNEKAGYEGKLIVESPPAYDSEEGPGVFDTLIVAHYEDNLRGDPTAGGIVIPYQPGFLVENTTFVNFDRARSSAFAWTRITGTCSSLCGGFKTETSGLEFINSNRMVRFEWESEGILYDRDGTLTGNASYSVAAWTNSFDPNNCVNDTRMSVDLPGSICSDNITLIRFAFNNPLPSSLLYKDAVFTNEFGSTFTAYARKRLTHKKGWSVVLMANFYYQFYWENADHMTNISYNSAFYNFGTLDYIVFTQHAERKPDQFKLDGSTSLPMSRTRLEGSDVRYGDWFYDVANRELTYAISRKVTRRKRDVSLSGTDFEIKFSAIHCYYRGCLKPKDPALVIEEPANKEFWSDASTWVNFTANNLKPIEDDDLTITQEKWIIVDEDIPRLGKLVINGGLQIDNTTTNITIDVEYIYITGQFVVGWSDSSPHKGNVVIRLRGSHATPAYNISSGPNLGAKFIATFGALRLHGEDRGIIKTLLSSTAMPGSNSITVKDSVAWATGDDILITTTDYSPWHTEVFKIDSISGNTITLNASIQYKHIAHTENINGQAIELSALVALLTRNIRIEGADYAEIQEESFGARVIAAQTAFDGKVYSGFAQISNVEFYHTGQEGFKDNYDARFSVTLSDIINSGERLSYVKKSSFHSGFNTAIGAFGVSDLEIDGNIVHHTVGPGIRTESSRTSIKNNLVVLSIWPGAYQDRREAMNVDFDGGIHAPLSTDLSLLGNIVVGSERAGYRVPGQSCDATDLWQNNVAHSCMQGVILFPKDPPGDSGCVLYHGFTVWKSVDFGIYYQSAPSIKVEGNIFVENSVGIFPFVVGPSTVSHQFADKKVTVENNIFIGKTSTFSDTVDGSDDNIALSGHARSIVGLSPSGKIGVMIGTFSAGTNLAPDKPFNNMMAYQSIKGLTAVNGNTFVNYGNFTDSDGRDFVIATNQKNDDGIHPTQISNTTLINVDESSLAYFHKPNVGKINSADCVDMDCDGLKKCMVRDLDGTFLGSVGTILPNSAFEWDGDRSHGLGDYRIPTAMLTTSAGNKIDVDFLAPHKGIYKVVNNCTWMTPWNAFRCGDAYEYRMLIIESMDADTETRRLSPVAIHNQEGYVDLINGPQDHGWCSGYTCRRRVSTFQAIVALGEQFDIYLSSTNPKVMRFMLLNSKPDECVRLGMWYMSTHRLELKLDGNLIYPKNAHIASDGSYRLRRQMTNHQYMPDVETDSNGANFVSQAEQMIFWIQCGDSIITIDKTEVFIVSFTIPPMNDVDFFGERLIENLAGFLGIDPDKVRIVDVVAEDSGSGRRKREASDSVTYVVEISDKPGDPPTVDYETVSDDIITAIQLGNIDTIVNTTVIYTTVILPATNGSSSSQPVAVQRPGYLVIATHPVGNGEESELLEVQPQLQVTDTNGGVVTLLGSQTTNWEVEVSIKSGGSPETNLLGVTRITFVEGWANFTDLAITQRGSYILEFNIVAPPQATNFSVDSLAVIVPGRNVGPAASIKTADSERLTKSPLELEVSLVNKDNNMAMTDIGWANHTWNAVASIYDTNSYSGALNGTLAVSFNTSTGKAIFTDLELSLPGTCPVLVNITSDPSDYNIQAVVYMTVVTSAQKSLTITEKRTLGMKFPVQYNPARAPYWTLQVVNYYRREEELLIVNSTHAEGSLLITLFLEATSKGYNNTLNSLCSNIENGVNFTFDGTTVAMSSYLTVDGAAYYGVSCGPIDSVDDKESSSDGLDTKYIIIIAVVPVVIFLLIAIILAYKFYFHPHAKTGDSTTNLGKGVYIRSDLLPDSLSREDTLSSLKSRPYTPSNPPLNTAWSNNKSFDLSVRSPSPGPHGQRVSPDSSNGSSKKARWEY